MARKKSPTLTEAELRLMEVLWQKRSATIADVTEALPPPPIAYNTVLTTMRILEQKGYVSHEEQGRAYLMGMRYPAHRFDGFVGDLLAYQIRRADDHDVHAERASAT